LLTNVTCAPALTTMSFGLTPLDVMVIVFVAVGVVDGVVDDEDDPPHEDATAAHVKATKTRRHEAKRVIIRIAQSFGPALYSESKKRSSCLRAFVANEFVAYVSSRYFAR